MSDNALSHRHIPALDGLRGLAILAVIFCHVNHALGGPLMAGRVNGPLAMLFGLGWVGVDLFFVLSGFLITGILFDAKGGDGFFRNFYARRTLRIMPLYFGFLFFATVVLPRLSWASDWECSHTDALSLWLYFYNFRVASTGDCVPFYHSFWSLAAEEHFYLIWPFVVWSLPRCALMWVCLVLATASFLLRVTVVLTAPWPTSAYFLTPCRLESLMGGAGVALAWKHHANWVILRHWAARLVPASAFFLLGLALGQRHLLPDIDSHLARDSELIDSRLVLTIGMAALAIFFSGLLVLTLSAPLDSRIRRFLESSALGAVGKYSYGMYVFHALLLAITMRFFGVWFMSIELVIAKPLLILWLFLVSFSAAWFSYHFYERPFLHLKRFFEYRRPVSSAAAVPSTPGSLSSHA